MITIIGRGHSGTRALAQTLYASNVYVGRGINPSDDLVPPDSMYEACRILARLILQRGAVLELVCPARYGDRPQIHRQHLRLSGHSEL